MEKFSVLQTAPVRRPGIIYSSGFDHGDIWKDSAKRRTPDEASRMLRDELAHDRVFNNRVIVGLWLVAALACSATGAVELYLMFRPPA